MGAHLRNGHKISIEQQQRNNVLRRAQSRGEQPTSKTERDKQAQRETDQPLDAGDRDRPAGLQQGDDSRYRLSAAATERLRKLKLQSASDQRNRHEKSSGGSAVVGIRCLSSPHQLASNLTGIGDNVQSVHPSTTPARTPEFRDLYEYRNRVSDSISDPSSAKSDPYPSDGSIPGPGWPGRHHSGQRATRDDHQLIQRSMAHVRPSERAPERCGS
ncbi:uncharacterized protein PGTG_05504 [Puccinia graminis f. sp. tritici CRL 75-36-700-3]|uniref:Uncharacterized protein n=1 Tax=Puccinia graminis f. sp. tritici (strain CRL 75-36-700-3 / race SCCL) TaxID=418459 RepID=E3K4L7_PUCGT|nr:uncharacterized protein PGTG_05504 [Puccinia graminis f. sp. tritici CRL 75-36-700-3]EFP79183.1 hypothetical protein PGTG_05504 [Puccinia graminis f. sp. tritici CRL 75-36-700-3]